MIFLLKGEYLILQKNSLIRPLLESKHGVHLSAYLVRNTNSRIIKKQLCEVMETARIYLAGIFSEHGIKTFLAPIEKLANDPGTLKKLNDNIVIFRTHNSFRIMNLPIEIKYTCILADSFHIKPLLRWKQFDRDFILIGAENEKLNMYRGNMHSLVKFEVDDVFEWAQEWAKGFGQNGAIKVFVVGKGPLTNKLFKKLKMAKIIFNPINDDFSSKKLDQASLLIRSILKNDSRKTFEKNLIEFHQADEMNLTNKNIFQIGRAAIEGRVKKLIVAEDLLIFGKLNLENGKIIIHPNDLDHEDDDLLDDLAQVVLMEGGEVIVANKADIPNENMAMAILKPDSESMTSTIRNDSKVMYRELAM